MRCRRSSFRLTSHLPSYLKTAQRIWELEGTDKHKISLAGVKCILLYHPSHLTYKPMFDVRCAWRVRQHLLAPLSTPAVQEMREMQ